MCNNNCSSKKCYSLAIYVLISIAITFILLANRSPVRLNSLAHMLQGIYLLFALGLDKIMKLITRLGEKVPVLEKDIVPELYRLMR